MSMSTASSADEEGPSNALREHLNPSTPENDINASGDEHSDAALDHRKIHRLLYVSHFLSTWNSRAFEFGAFLFLATIYPHTLLPASVYALTRAASAAAISSWIGRYIDHAERLRAVRLSIIGQRLAVALSCALFLALLQLQGLSTTAFVSYLFLSLLSLLACAEKLSAVMNTISVERDWVVIIAGDREDHLRTMNSQMRRIDLFCKLMAPLFVSFIDSASSKLAILVTGAMTAVSVLIEYFAIARVYKAVPALKERKAVNSTATASSRSIYSQVKHALSASVIYFTHPAFLPSFSLALLYLTVLSFSGQMITYLLAIGVQSGLIGILRGVSALFELSATWLAPKIMARIGPIRSGIWFVNWETFCVALACLFFWLDFAPTIAAAGTVSAVIASRIGLWGFDLSVQIIVQEEVEAEWRGTFSSQEFAFQNVFEMLSFASTIIFAEPSQFKYPATISAAAVGIAGVLYATFVRTRRGHLVHLSRCMDRNGKTARQEWRRVPQADDEIDEYELGNA